MKMKMSLIDENTHADSLNDMPSDIIIYICKYLNGIDIINMSQVSRNFRFLIRQNINYLGISQKFWDTQFMIKKREIDLYQKFINNSVDSVIYYIAFDSNDYMTNFNKKRIYNLIKKDYIDIKYLNKIREVSLYTNGIKRLIGFSMYLNDFPQYYDICLKLLKTNLTFSGDEYYFSGGYLKFLIEKCYKDSSIFSYVVELLDDQNSPMDIFHILNEEGIL